MDAPAHTQFIDTKDLRSQDLDTVRDSKAGKWNKGAWSGPGRNADGKHLTPAASHLTKHHQRTNTQGHGRRKSAALVGGIDLEEELDLAHGDEIVPTSPRALAGKVATLRVGEDDDGSDDSDYDEESSSRVPPVPGAKDAYSGMIDQELEKANQRADDGEYLIVVDDEAIPSDPAERRKYKRDQEAEYVVVKTKEAKEE